MVIAMQRLMLLSAVAALLCAPLTIWAESTGLPQWPWVLTQYVMFVFCAVSSGLVILAWAVNRDRREDWLPPLLPSACLLGSLGWLGLSAYWMFRFSAEMSDF